MPPRKRRKNVSEESDWQCSSKEDAGPEGSSDDFPGRKIGVENPLIVISDSEGEEAKEENTVSKKRGRLQLDRRRTGCKRRIAQMTEEEQFALAVKISEQEANHGNYSAEEESELLRKAIEESLYSCEVSDIPEKVSEQELKKENSSINEDICSTELDKALPLSQSSDQGIVKSPVVSLIRLSQDIVESSSVILSPNCKDLFSEIGSEPHTPCLSNTSAFSSKCATQQLALSPIFPKQSPLSLKLFPRKLFPGKSPGSTGFQEDVDDQFSHCSESSEHDSVSLLPISPPKSMKMENSLQKMIDEKSALFNGDSAILDAKESASTFSTDISEHEGIRVQQTEGSVHYYWGVPFCPKGVDPNVYTQVILCQLEVYQKSLKRAQRQLLHKMDFGEPIDLVAASHQNEKGDSQGSVSQEDQRDECVPKLRPESDCEESENSDKSVTRRVSSRRRQFENKMHSPQDEESSVAPQEEPACSTSQTLFMEVNLVECAGDDPEEASESVPSLIDEANGKSPGEQHEDVQAEEQEITVCPADDIRVSTM
ncbi:BRCA1-A complex subunit RAP80 isoform X3 [Pelobates cultripes]|uniref:BRCA1-A complex subunit RAP80 n=1 Tax=Pelobates cultripes TaxID=61616 RepID=A0AAD1W1D6_PELCU|nr:BRCA1-A complex subunit RAP80 isoform X3 [Pelobates cultripes]